MHEQMTIRMGQRGTIVVPAKIRKRLGMKQNTAVLLIEEDDRLILQPLPSLTAALVGISKGCHGRSAREVEAWLDRDREDR